MLESRWPRRPLIALIVLIPALIILNPFIRAAIHKGSGPVQADAITSSAAPADQGPYVAGEIDSLAGRFWARVAGTDTDEPPHVNGHDEFARAWLAQMRANLHGLPFGVFQQYMPVPGFAGHPAKTLGKNIVVFVPGSASPNLAVVIGSHYDGDPDSKGSAFDDTSGSAIILGLARSLGAHWRARGLPRLTVEFVIFDAEEQGMIGSGSYLYYLRHGAIMPKPVMMIDEEQSGVQYPVHPFGLASEPLLPSYSITTAEGSVIQKLFHPVIQPKSSVLALMRSHLLRDRTATFSALHSVYPTLALHGRSVPAFSESQEKDVVVGPTPVCCSDNAPFEALGLPTVTFSGNFTFYHHKHADWAYPFDQPGDTPAALACDTGGAPTPSKSLEAALDMPLVMSYQLVNQYSPTDPKGKTVALMTDRVVGGKRAEFSAATAEGGGSLRWSFGDGSTAVGATVFHRYARPGTYDVALRSPHSSASRTLVVYPTVAQPHLWTNIPKAPKAPPWHPKELKGIAGCP